MPRLPWIKWFPQDWVSDPGIAQCDPSTRGIWADAVNFMLLQQSPEISGSVEELSRLLRCRPVQLQAAVTELERFNVCEVRWQNDGITMANRRIRRELEIKGVRSKSGSKGAENRWQRSASASASASKDRSAEGRKNGISDSQRITYDKSLVRINSRLSELNGNNIPPRLAQEKSELLSERKRLMQVLDIKA